MLTTNIKWHSYVKYIDNIEIEIKVRSKKAVDNVIIAHRGIKEDLTSLQKIKVSFIKSVLSNIFFLCCTINEKIYSK